MTGIYIIVNKRTRKSYIGSSRNIQIRLKQHLKKLQRNEHHSYRLQEAFNVHGEKAFRCAVLEITSVAELAPREQFWIDFCKSADINFGYNICPTAYTVVGIKRRTESIERYIRSRLRYENSVSGIMANYVRRLEGWKGPAKGVHTSPATEFSKGHTQGFQKGNTYGKANKGSQNPRARLCTREVKEIKSLLAAGLTCKVISARYGVIRQTISNIKFGRAWTSAAA